MGGGDHSNTYWLKIVTFGCALLGALSEPFLRKWRINEAFHGTAEVCRTIIQRRGDIGEPEEFINYFYFIPAFVYTPSYGYEQISRFQKFLKHEGYYKNLLEVNSLSHQKRFEHYASVQQLFSDLEHYSKEYGVSDARELYKLYKWCEAEELPIAASVILQAGVCGFIGSSGYMTIVGIAKRP